MNVEISRLPRSFSRKPRLNLRVGWTAYWNTLWIFAVIAVASAFLEPLTGYRAVGFLFLLGVLGIGALGARGPVLFAALLSAFGWNFLFIPPRFTFNITNADDLILCVTYLVAAVITGFLTFRLRSHESMLRDREERTYLLYEILKEMTSSRGVEQLVSRVIERLNLALNGTCGVVLPTSDGGLDETSKILRVEKLNANELAVAQWSYSSGQEAGWSTSILSEAQNLHLPLKTAAGIYGVLLFQPRAEQVAAKEILHPDETSLLRSVCGQLALALERRGDEVRLRHAERLQDSEVLHQTLLNSISHEMRTPLTAILGSASALSDEHAPDTKEFKQALASELVFASDRLNRVIENLLDMSRLSSGVLSLNRDWQDIHDLVGVTLKGLGRNLERHRLKVELPAELPLIEIDFRLFEHALANLLMNAAQYAPAGAEILISAKVVNQELWLTVEDSGKGIDPAHLDRLFDKFYRVPGSPAGGTGLGLSIVKSIVELHKGSIHVENRPAGGSRFVIQLPLGSAPRAPEELDAKNSDR